MSELDYNPTINVKSRIRKLGDRKDNLTKTSELVLGSSNGMQGFNNTGSFNNTGNFSTDQSSYVPRQRQSINSGNNQDNKLNSQGSGFQNSNGFFGNSNGFNSTNNNGMDTSNNRQPLLSENQIDRHTQNLTQEIENLDIRLNKNQSTNNNYSSNNNYSNPPRERDSSQGYVPRVRDRSVNNDEAAKKTFRGTQNSFTGSTTNTSLNGTFGAERMQQQYFNGLDHFEAKENQLKEQLKQFEKEKQQKEKLQALQESAKRNSTQKQNSFKNDNDLQLKLSSPTFNKKKEKKQAPPSNPFQKNSNSKNNDIDLEGSMEYVPGNFGKNNDQKMRGTGNLNNTKGFSKPPKPQPKNNDEEVAIATGIQDCPMEESQPDNSELFTCPEGCGRQFNEEALKKHIPICKKIFQQKRQTYNTEKKRQVDEDQSKLKRQGQIKEKMHQRQQSREKSSNKKTSNLADIKKKLKQQKEQQGGQVDQLA